MKNQSHMLTYIAGINSSIVHDFFVRNSPKSHILFSTFERLPVNVGFLLKSEISIRVLKLNSLTTDYAQIWKDISGEPWTVSSPTRIASERRKLQIDIDVLTGLSLGLSVDELCTIYRTQFPVLRGYEERDMYDSNGRKLPRAISKLYRNVGDDDLIIAERRWTHPQSGVEYTFELPFRSFDREEDMRAAYTKFSTMLEEQGEIIEDGE